MDITPEQDFAALLNRKAGKEVLLSLWNPEVKKRWEEVVKPISLGQERELLYERWMETRRKEIERLSNERIGYVHVEGMNSPSYRTFYGKALGRNNAKEGLVADTRFNGGGWLHEDSKEQNCIHIFLFFNVKPSL